jgi:2-oxoisovalerate dehydrogenase E1 component
MVVIREFETMLDRIKKEGSYQGIEYQHKGPAHLPTGQEAAAVGQALNLGAEDFIFGSHRSHGEILAKSLSAIAKLDDSALTQVMTTYNNGETLRIVETFQRSGVVRSWRSTMYSLARWLKFLAGMQGSTGAGGVDARILPALRGDAQQCDCGGLCGYCDGLGVCSSGSTAGQRIVIANIGDASLGCGPVWEAMMFAAMRPMPQSCGRRRPAGLPRCCSIL